MFVLRLIFRRYCQQPCMVPASPFEARLGNALSELMEDARVQFVVCRGDVHISTCMAMSRQGSLSDSETR